MPDPERGPTDQDKTPPSGPPAPADPTRPDDDATDEAASKGEAREEAENLGAVPYARFKKDEES